ncbi:bifunctional 4-hydroxy-2-oxoglutarate aldolase/2-dehydro-3-deoxy-phosphogluconate aldolase [Microvirga thermotolerans]|uniref:2-dehydro-3-deoxy-phosphogluconate aldolase n=1 Tax=Microvirga thermotolerans TaxID=2651334 RepID=A0A5P9JV96_9HYPH|nr:bifunctional 4-hydroxy-2-oxoglutarate aldolase/2-dehydro-3-deoxy-phosphogluconate aldolase [Microvirga thermotolerans]QFU15370.1 bifunctional 4-hydroxy-2-oxoglutarate aldolase/2-dehydro-3-deoxy-phosphogluconate aldolase [Microvirga thermotolerans]
MKARTETLRKYVRMAPVIPVVTIEDARTSIDLAHTLVRAGLAVVEVTLRTPAALDAIAAIAKAVPEAIVAAGTVLTESQIAEVADAGAKFIVTPGTPPKLAERLSAAPIPVMPGCATVTEAMALAEAGFEILKFFPASASGGAAWLRSVQGPLPALSFCPTGGIDQASAPAYLSLANVPCVGGTWVAPAELLRKGDFDRIGELAAAAAALRRPT